MEHFLDSITIIGSPKAKPQSYTWNEGLIRSVVTCYSATSPNDSLTTCVAELAYGMNPSSGCQYPLTNPFVNTTGFERDYLYSDYPNSETYGRYNSVLSSTNYFSQTFPNNNLQDDEWAVAYTAFTLAESGYTFCVVVHPSETGLENFCNIQRWDYRIIDS